MKDELKPCPFCGGKAFMWSWNGGTRIDCENWSGKDEQTHYVGVGAKTETEAIEAWNRRASDKQKEKVTEAVRMAVEALKRETSGDAIDRQAAIRIASGYCHPANVAKELAKLQSVQPDIIACGDCKHYIPHDKRCGYWNHGVQPLMWCSQAERRTDD